MQHAPNAACPKCSMPQMQHAPNAACPKCSMPQMQHAPFRHVRVAYPRIISAPVSARIKYTNFSGNNQTMSRGEKELSDGMARVHTSVCLGAHTLVCISCRLKSALPVGCDWGAHASACSLPHPDPLPAGEGISASVGAIRLVPITRTRRGALLVVPTHLRQCLLLSFADESRRSRSAGSAHFSVHPSPFAD